LDQKLISYRYSSCCFSSCYCRGDLFKSLKFRRFKSGRDEIWHGFFQLYTHRLTESDFWEDA